MSNPVRALVILPVLQRAESKNKKNKKKDKNRERKTILIAPHKSPSKNDIFGLTLNAINTFLVENRVQV